MKWGIFIEREEEERKLTVERDRKKTLTEEKVDTAREDRLLTDDRMLSVLIRWSGKERLFTNREEFFWLFDSFSSLLSHISFDYR